MVESDIVFSFSQANISARGVTYRDSAPDRVEIIINEDIKNIKNVARTLSHEVVHAYVKIICREIIVEDSLFEEAIAFQFQNWFCLEIGAFRHGLIGSATQFDLKNAEIGDEELGERMKKSLLGDSYSGLDTWPANLGVIEELRDTFQVDVYIPSPGNFWDVMLFYLTFSHWGRRSDTE